MFQWYCNVCFSTFRSSFSCTSSKLPEADLLLPLELCGWRIMKLIFCASVTFGMVVTADANTIIRSLSDLPYDEKAKLSTHLLVYPDMCVEAIEAQFGSKPYGRELQPVAGDALMAFFGEPVEEYQNKYNGNGRLQLSDCRAACVERGVDRSVVQAVMPVYRFEGRNEKKKIEDWLSDSCQKVEFGFINYHNEDTKKAINVYWVSSADGTLHPLKPLEWGERKTNFIQTYLGHKFLFEDQDTKEVLLEHTVEFTGVRSIGQLPSQIDPTKDVTTQIHGASLTEWNKHKQVTRTFTKLGFGKGRLPDDLFASMAAYNYNNNDYRVLEEWSSDAGVYINRWETDLYFIQGPWRLKVVWQTRIKELVEAWANTKLENTAMYGLRRYEEGARLLTHVDRINTHAASVIINVAQGNVTKPWTVEVYDHADRLHEVVMEPGDIVYYESAKILHGRNTPLQGKGAYYVNMFSHYRPEGDPEWYKRPNPEGTPEPLMDVGECRLEGLADQYSQGAVKCDDPTVGPHLSPSMFVARSGEDLFDWWRKVGKEAEESVRDEEL